MRSVYQYGAAIIPPEAGETAASLISTCDPALEGLLTVFKTVLNAKLDAAWQAAASGLGAEYGAHVVNDTYAINPVPEVARRTWGWPVLAGWRVSEKFSDRTLIYDGEESEIALVYALPPMSLEFANRLGHIRTAVVRTLRGLIENQGDDSYDSENFLYDLGIEALTLTEARYGEAFDEGNLQQMHIGVDMTLVLKECEMPNTEDLGDCTEISTAIDLVPDAGSGSDLENAMLFSFDPTE